MKRESFPALTIIVLIFGVAALFQSTMQPQKTNGCLWDYDTLAAEAKGLPGITEIITGRFDRFPPLYYQMRLDRVSEQVLSSSDDLELYDNAGVACDRLKRSDEAIEWMAKKRVVLDRLIEQGQDVSEHEYRYLANLGTFHVHRWLINGADRSDISDVDTARQFIGDAIRRNPNAHFGREKYQLLAIEWIRSREARTHNDYLSIDYSIDSIAEIQGLNTELIEQLLARGTNDEAIKGYSGLITLGAAWESIDIYHALADSLGHRGDNVLAKLCMMRVKELARNGHKSLDPFTDSSAVEQSFPASRGSVSTSYIKKIESTYYPKARAEANLWIELRNEYITAKLLNGDHPDTNPEFWNDWKETTSPPRYPLDIRRKLLTKPALVTIVILSGMLLLFILRKQKTQTT